MKKLKNWIIKHKIANISAFFGAIIGLLYWKFVGCSTGTCAITSVWYRTMLYGAVMGWLLGDILKDKFKKHGKI